MRFIIYKWSRVIPFEITRKKSSFILIDSLGGIDMDPINNNRVGASSPVEYVSPETKKEYEDLLEEVNKILKKNPLLLYYV